MKKLTFYFDLNKIANDFRFHFITKLSNKSVAGPWRSSTKIRTNETQDAVFFSQEIRYDTDRVIEGVYRDIQGVLQEMRDIGFVFDVLCIRKGREYEFTNIKWAD